jgi:hypothetical protein
LANQGSGDILDYILDIGPAIVGNDGDGIATAAVNLAPSNPGDLELKSTTADGSRIILWLSGGQAGTVYTITFGITTINGRSLQRSVLLPVLLLSVQVFPPNAIVTTSGVVNRSEWKSRIVQLVCSIHLGLHHASRTHTCYCGQPYPPKQGARRTITYAHD